jgi:hypothetical protein
MNKWKKNQEGSDVYSSLVCAESLSLKLHYKIEEKSLIKAEIER